MNSFMVLCLLASLLAIVSAGHLGGYGYGHGGYDNGLGYGGYSLYNGGYANGIGSYGGHGTHGHGGYRGAGGYHGGYGGFGYGYGR